MKNVPIILAFIFLLIFLSGCIDNHANEIMAEYNQHNDTFNKDLKTVSSLENEWGYAAKFIPAGDYYTDKELNELSQLAGNYSDECSYVAAHNSNFKTFIAAHEAVLKDKNVDIYSLNKSIIDSEIQMNANSKHMNETVQYAEEHTLNKQISNTINGIFDKASKIGSVMTTKIR